MGNYSVIDLGSNSIRLVVYEVREGAKPPFTKRDFRSLINQKKIAGLSSYVSDGIFSQEGVRKATDVLGEHLRRSRNFQCRKTRIFATAVLRNCGNSKEACKAISSAIDMPIDLLSEREEAHLGFVGATCNRRIERGALIDVGGGSTELTSIRKFRDVEGVSIPQGSVSSYAQHVSLILPTKEEIADIEKAFEARLNRLDGLDTWKAGRLFGIGGATRAIWKFLTPAGMGGIASREVERDRIEGMLEMLEAEPSAFAHRAVKACPERLHTLIPGTVIALCLMRRLGAGVLEICKYGVREGYLIERILGRG